jgi:hypothetical protein
MIYRSNFRLSVLIALAALFTLIALVGFATMEYAIQASLIAALGVIAIALVVLIVRCIIRSDDVIVYQDLVPIIMALEMLSIVGGVAQALGGPAFVYDPWICLAGVLFFAALNAFAGYEDGGRWAARFAKALGFVGLLAGLPQRLGALRRRPEPARP